MLISRGSSQLDLPSPDHRERVAWWRHVLGGVSGADEATEATEATEAAEAAEATEAAAQALSPHKLSPQGMRGTAEAAAAQAAAEQRAVTTADLLRTARLHNAAGLEQVARRVEPSADWDDLVLAEQPMEQLRELAARHRHRQHVLTDWRLRPHHGRGRGVTALFAGDSGPARPWRPRCWPRPSAWTCTS